MGIIVNFTNRTIQGFGDPEFGEYPIRVTAWNDVTVAFAGSENSKRLASSTRVN